MGRDRQDELSCDCVLRRRSEKLAQDRYGVQPGHGLLGLPPFLRDKPSQDHGLTIADSQARLRCPGAEFELRDFGTLLQDHLLTHACDLNLKLEGHLIHQVHRGLHCQFDPGVFEFRRGDGGGCRHRAGRGLPRQDIGGRQENGLLVPYVNRGLLLVEDSDLGRGQRLGIGLLFKEIQKHGRREGKDEAFLSEIRQLLQGKRRGRRREAGDAWGHDPEPSLFCEIHAVLQALGPIHLQDLHLQHHLRLATIDGVDHPFRKVELSRFVADDHRVDVLIRVHPFALQHGTK